MSFEMDSRQFESRMKELENNVKEVMPILEGFAHTCVRQIKSNTPVRTGALRNGIEMEIIDNGVLIQSTAEYSTYVEYGTSRMAAQPFFERVIRENLPTLKRLIEEKLKK